MDSRRDYNINLLGPIRADVSWQARTEGAYTQSLFEINWEKQKVICPQGKESRYWKPWTKKRKKPMVQVHFHQKDCEMCPARALCTKRKNGPRELTFQEKTYQQTLDYARKRQKSKEFKEVYTIRSGVEGTISQAAFAHGIRRTRYIGLDKTHLQQVAASAAINLKRVVDWINDVPRAKTYRSPFAKLIAA